MDHCLQQNAVGGPCQKDRDGEILALIITVYCAQCADMPPDQCAPADNWKDYASYLNVNGSICLNFQCYWANGTAGQSCINDNTYYEDTADNGVTFSFMVSRDNCNSQYFYCDGSSSTCVTKKRRGEDCSAAKECFSFNCLADGKCGKAADEPLKPKVWEYVVIGIAIVVVIVGVMTALWFLHRRWREENQVQLEQYYNEQIAYRQSIMSMSHAKNSLLSLPHGTSPLAARDVLYSEGGEEQQPTTAYTSARQADELIPPNMRREGSTSFSDDSEVLLMDQQAGASSGPRYRG